MNFMSLFLICQFVWLLFPIKTATEIYTIEWTTWTPPYLSPRHYSFNIPIFNMLNEIARQIFDIFFIQNWTIVYKWKEEKTVFGGKSTQTTNTEKCEKQLLAEWQHNEKKNSMFRLEFLFYFPKLHEFGSNLKQK